MRRRAGASRKMFSGAADRDATAVTGRGERIQLEGGSGRTIFSRRWEG